MAEFFPKRWVAAISTQLQGTAVASPPNRRSRESRKAKELKRQRTSLLEAGNNRSASRASAPRFISTKATDNLLQNRDTALRRPEIAARFRARANLLFSIS